MPPAVASLGYEGGPSVVFRLNPNDVKWNFTVNTSVQPTVGGRVIQVTGATLSDMTVIGSLGEIKAGPSNKSKVSWELAERFVASIRAIMERQTRDSNDFAKMQAPPIFNFPLRNWRFNVYVKALQDPKGGAISHSPDHFSHEYALTLFIVQDAGGVLDKKRQEAINNYIIRISDGIGWKPSKYNGVGFIAGKDIKITKDSKPIPPNKVTGGDRAV